MQSPDNQPVPPKRGASEAPEAKSSKSARPRIDYIDGLRGLAFMLVVFHHCFNQTGEPVWKIRALHGVNPLRLFQFGNTGVHLFLVLSGFCLANSFASAGGLRKFNLKAFASRRAWRILPAYWAALILCLVYPVVFQFVGKLIGIHTPGVPEFSLSSTVLHALLLHGLYFPYFMTINGPFWSLSLEWQFYFTFPVLLYLFHKRGPWATIGLVGIVTLVYRIFAQKFLLTGDGTYDFAATSLFLGRWTEFCLGMLAAWQLAHLERSNTGDTDGSPKQRAVWYVLAVVGLLGGLRTRSFTPLHDLMWGILYYSLLCIAMIHDGGWRRFLSSRSLVWIGGISYSLYLIHQPVIDIFVPLLRLKSGSPVSMLVATIVVLGIAMPAAYLFHQLFEKPFMSPSNVRRTMARFGINIPEPAPADKNAPEYRPVFSAPLKAGTLLVLIVGFVTGFLFHRSKPDVAAEITNGPPVVTSAPVVGVWPNVPFTFAMSASGATPVHYTAFKLPTGITLDSNTGTISGKLSLQGHDAGETIQIQVSNPHGLLTTGLRIVPGSTLALTPPRGWNSYDCFGDTITETEVMQNASYMASTLLKHGYEYLVVDYRWYDPRAIEHPTDAKILNGEGMSIDEFGRLIPALNRFPTSANGNGFKSLARAMHAMGLKFGMHMMRGVPRMAVEANMPIENSKYRATDIAVRSSTCHWCTDMYGIDMNCPGGQDYYDSLFRLYASWGVDLIKVDDIAQPYSSKEIDAVRKAIDKAGRPMVLSLSPGSTPVEEAAHVTRNANMWRVSADFWDDWKSVDKQFDLLSSWHDNAGPGHWPDADMIPLGHISVKHRSVGRDRSTRLNRDEQVTLMSLWAMAPSPLMLGMNLPDLDPWTRSLITNDDVLAVNQDAAGAQAVRVEKACKRTGPAKLDVWTKKMSDGSTVVGLFNRNKYRMAGSARVLWSDLGMKPPRRAINLWKHEDVHVDPDGIDTWLGPHGCLLLRTYAPL